MTDMKTFLISGVSALALAGTAFATPFEDADTNDDGSVSLSEVQAIDPATSEAEFTLYDVDLDGELNEEEYATWRVATQGEGESESEYMYEQPETDDPVMDEPMTEDPMDDDPLADSEPADLDEVPDEPYEPSPEKSFTDDEDKGEYTGEAPEPNSHSFENEAEKLAYADEYGDDHGDDEESEDEESDDYDDTDEEDGEESDPWK